jgi:hypothetical protein
MLSITRIAGLVCGPKSTLRGSNHSQNSQPTPQIVALVTHLRSAVEMKHHPLWNALSSFPLPFD